MPTLPPTSLQSGLDAFLSSAFLRACRARGSCGASPPSPPWTVRHLPAGTVGAAPSGADGGGFEGVRRQSYRRTSLDTISTKSRLSKATIYRHFSGKEALFEAIVVQMSAIRLHDVALDPDDPVSGLRAVRAGCTR